MNDLGLPAHGHSTDPEPDFSEAEARRMRELFAARDDRDARREPGLTEAEGEELDALVSRWQKAHLEASRAGAPPAWPPEPEPVRPGIYQESGLDVLGPVEVLAVVRHARLSDGLVVYLPVDPSPLCAGVRVTDEDTFLERFTRLPDTPLPGGENADG